MSTVEVENEGLAPEEQSTAAPWAATVAKYNRPVEWKSWFQVANSVIPFFGLWYLMYLCSSWSYALMLLLALPTAGCLVRIFIIQHDCGHHSFFGNHRLNDIVGTLCSLLTLTPYQSWRRSHARHHVTSGNLDRRGFGDILTLTISEYESRSWWGKLAYRIYRNPLFMFVVGAPILFLILQRFTLGIPKSWKLERLSVHLTNLGLVTGLIVAWQTIGLSTFLSIHLPVVIIGSAAGTWLFFVQHQYEEAYWERQREWDFTQSAMQGSSFYRLPAILQWFSGNIGFHHIHHLNSRIPNYHLEACYKEDPSLRNAVTFGIRDSIHLGSLKLWDEQHHRLISFKEYDAMRRSRPA